MFQKWCLGYSNVGLPMFADHQHLHKPVFDELVLAENITLRLKSSNEAAGQARLVMRQRGNFRLLLNANLWPQMPVIMMDGGKASFLPFFLVHRL